MHVGRVGRRSRVTRGAAGRGDRCFFERKKEEKKGEKYYFQMQNFANLFLTNFSDGHDGHNLDNAAYA
jgi:hypothetical protein